MSPLKAVSLFLLSSWLLACGYQVVEFPLATDAEAGSESGVDGAARPVSDASADAPTEGASDSGFVASADATVDAGSDTGVDASGIPRTDGSLDAGVGPLGDAAVDASPDVRTDASLDASFDAPMDAAAAIDSGLDASTDASLDGSLDAGIDASTDASLDGSLDAGIDAASAPAVISTTPPNGAGGVSINERPTATFNEAMDPTTLTALTFTLMQGLTPVLGVVTYDALTNTATFAPTAPLLVNMPYTAQITTGAAASVALGGAPLAANYSWSFMTAACSQAPVTLGSAANFVVLAGSTVTNTGPTSVTGDLGVSPGTAVTGFPPGTVIGAQHAGDPISAQGIADLTIAYNDAAGRMLCPINEAGNLGGLTLAPGLYNSTSSLEISSGDLTLDAQGDGNAIFIFQMATTLITTAGRQVVLAGGAKAANVYWQVGSSATIGTTSAFQGTIMADQSITLNNGATLNGRALARIAAVALDSNTIVKPAP